MDDHLFYAERIAGLERDWTETGNPIAVFQAIQLCCRRALDAAPEIATEADYIQAIGQVRFPAWVTLYLQQCAASVGRMADGNAPELAPISLDTHLSQARSERWCPA